MLQFQILIRPFVLARCFIPLVQTNRCYRPRWARPFLRDLWGRRQLLGPERPKPRSAKFDWNYDAEIFAFGKRLGENFQIDTLKKMFIHPAYAKHDAETRSKMSAQPSTSAPMNDNSDFVQKGDNIISNYVKAFLRYHFRNLPEEGIIVLHNHLTSDANLATLSKHIGTYDLILTTEFPIAEKTLRDSFTAVIGALDHDQGLSRAELFVRDFILTQLVNFDINEIFHVSNPMEILKSIVESRGRGVPEPRIIRQAGSFTILPIFVVGIYSDKELLGSSAGETVQIATEMAARESLKFFWGTKRETLKPYAFNEPIELQSYKEKENEKLRDVLKAENEQFLVLTNPIEKEPFDVERMAVFYKDKVEKSLGTPIIRRLRHKFHFGTPMRKVRTNFIKPKPETI